jgi:hypothetical protein
MKHADFLAKGGVFIKDNKEVGGYGTPDLYCTDPSVTMEQLKKSMIEVKKEVIARQRKIVKGY